MRGDEPLAQGFEFLGLEGGIDGKRRLRRRAAGKQGNGRHGGHAAAQQTAKDS